MHNAFVSGMRARRAADRELDGDLPELSQAPTQLHRLEVRDVLAGLSRLPEAQRAALVLIALEDFSYSDAAHVLGVPLGTLMSRLARGRETLRRAMQRRRAAALARHRRRPMNAPEVHEDELHAFVDGQLPRGRCTTVFTYLGGHPEEVMRLAAYARQKEELRARLEETGLPTGDPKTAELQQALADRLAGRSRYRDWLRLLRPWRCCSGPAGGATRCISSFSRTACPTS